MTTITPTTNFPINFYWYYYYNKFSTLNTTTIITPVAITTQLPLLFHCYYQWWTQRDIRVWPRAFSWKVSSEGLCSRSPLFCQSGGQAGTGNLLCNKPSLLLLMLKSMKLLRIRPALAMELKPGGYQEYQERPSGTFRHRILCYMWSSSLTALSRSWVLEGEQSWPLCPAPFPPMDHL